MIVVSLQHIRHMVASWNEITSYGKQHKITGTSVQFLCVRDKVKHKFLAAIMDHMDSSESTGL